MSVLVTHMNVQLDVFVQSFKVREIAKQLMSHLAHNEDRGEGILKTSYAQITWKTKSKNSFDLNKRENRDNERLSY